MGHAHHFLERLDRVDRAQTEFALALYRDHEAVAYVLSHVNLPENAARVALAIDDPREGPFVVVTRDGKFVTCLGHGMHHDHPVVPRPQLEALLAKVAEKRARRELAQRELRPDESEGDIFKRVLTRGSRLAREDFLAMSAFEPLLGAGPFVAMVDLGLEATQLRAAICINPEKVVVKGSTQRALEKLDRIEWAVAHLAVLSGAAERRALDTFVKPSKDRGLGTFLCSAQGGATFFLRAAWLVARFGKVTIPQVKAALESSAEWMTALDAGLGLAAIGIRHAGAANEVRRILDGYGPGVETPTNLAETKANICRGLLDAMDKEDEYLESGIKMGRSLTVGLSAHLPEGHPQRFAKEEDVPDGVARTTTLAFDGDIFNHTVQQFMIASVVTAARASAEDFYHPRELVRAWYGQWSAEETRERLTRWMSPNAKSTPIRVEAPPGRNDPCTCGSGKKWKKCHGSV